MRLLAADPLGGSRETSTADGDLTPYERAFQAIDAEPAHLLVVAENSQEVVSTLQLTFIASSAPTTD